ncbi:uroporphyrinogen decarboxylase/cobalamine-independent methonine synthase family protein [Arthrobacter sp. MDB2-24]
MPDVATTDDDRRAVGATAAGDWPGSDPLEANRAVRGEFGGAANLPFLPSLPGRGPGSDAVGRTLGVLVELPFDLQPHGWRLVQRPGRDQRRAESALSSDINALGDIAGAEESPALRLKLHLHGPLSLAAGVHLHSGERVLIDSGARRELYESLAAGAADLVRRVASVARGAQLLLQLDEPDADAVLAGRVPTASGYRTLRAVDRREATEAWDLVTASAVAAGAAGTVLVAGNGDTALDAARSSAASALSLPLHGISDRRWEALAEDVESGRQLELAILQPEANLPQVRALVESVLAAWRRVGLPVSALAAVRLTTLPGLAALSPSDAVRALTRLAQVADALDQVRAEG